jgi:hypothetical protein
MKRLLTLLSAVLCLLVSSCFDVHEELWVHADGSGEIEAKYTIPTAALAIAGGRESIEDQVHQALANDPNLELKALELTSSGESSVLRAKVSAKSLRKLIQLKNNSSFQELPSSAGAMAGDFKVATKGLQVDFTRTIRPADALGFGSLAISREQKQKRHLTYVIHLPTAATEHNAQRVEDGGRTLIWDSTLNEALKAPIITHVVFKMPMPMHIVLPILITAALVLAWIVRKFTRRAIP